jgi:hypothetical protein
VIALNFSSEVERASASVVVAQFMLCTLNVLKYCACMRLCYRMHVNS